MIGGCWVEKLEVDCRVPGDPADRAADPIAELRRLIDARVRNSDVFRAEVTGIAEELRAQLPPECRAVLGLDEEEAAGVLAAIVEEGTEDVLARLHADAGTASP